MEIISQLTLNSIRAGAIYTLMALGFNLIYGVVKFFNLAHGVVAAIGGYIVFLLTGALGLNLYLGVAAGVFFAGLAGYGFDKLVFLPLRRRKTSSMVLLVASLGVFTSVQAVIAIFFTSEFRTLGAVSAGDDIYSFSGGVLGSFLLGFVENFGIWKVPGEWKEAIAFFLLILFLLVRPEGIMKR